MNEQQILANLMKNPDYRAAMRQLILNDKDLAEEVCPTSKSAYVWCAEMVDQNTGVTYYHPIVVPNKTMTAELESMMDVNNYAMLASMDQFEAYEEEPTVKMFTSVYGQKYPIRLITVPEDVFNRLLAALTALVVSILNEVRQCFVHMDNIARMSNTDADMMKMRFISSVFGCMTTVDACFDKNMEISDSSNHDYVVYEEDDEEYDEEDDWEDEWD